MSFEFTLPKLGDDDCCCGAPYDELGAGAGAEYDVLGAGAGAEYDVLGGGP